MRMRPFTPLPEPLADGPFNLAEAWPVGLTRGRARGRDLLAPFWGVRAPTSTGTFLERLRAADQIRAVDEAFSHQTAARLLGIPLPEPWQETERVHICGETELPGLRRVGIAPHRGLERRTVVTVEGMPCTEPLTTWADLAVSLSTDDLVVIGDAILNLGTEWSLAALRATVGARARRRGVVRMRKAVELVRPGSRSPMESRTRLLFVRSGLPEPELNAAIVDAAGEWLAFGDFVWRDRRVVAEFDCDHHRTDRRQWQIDVARREAVQEAGWTYLQLTARMVTVPAYADRLVQRLSRLCVMPKGQVPLSTRRLDDGTWPLGAGRGEREPQRLMTAKLSAPTASAIRAASGWGSSTSTLSSTRAVPRFSLRATCIPPMLMPSSPRIWPT
jgi:hypothetical protein